MPRRNYPKNQPKSARMLVKPTLTTTDHDACRRKRRFATEQIARRAADTQELMSPKLELDVYYCRGCDGWHLTSRASRD
ncbi:hypothetical protein GWK77_01835 [Candidatus Saccharibacteria bacterium oral taxon 488]|nr:hypothetical protein GWK77_01835 [Candidatus Saccharibacteria bacterium oral taxon 488]